MTTIASSTYAHGLGDDAFSGGVFDGENIWLAPHDADYIVKVNPATGAMTRYAHGYGNNAFTDAVFDGESVWFTPEASDYLVIGPRHGRHD